ncbi:MULTISPECIES: hypothetical protein [unclassified Paenibacillus]|uniref:hypothetical protein n=1 Tax=unclassified Paenibacillus TaxID=185978 RepID=UPI001AE5C143|nr:MULTISPECIES: hypothetical protein [unclassified Paenibacillus]MBP1155458.1 hypothetical protein [Paenibacillus sp. PvP091]MBP1169157.1 hypothetical protein [Paenibacillus sp. PvR098]MBP2440185.1 hypothetical protein [Paenibacillus sp. PvP052]
MAPPGTYRRGKIEEFVERLEVRRTVLLTQLDQPEFQDLQQIIKGQLTALDLVISELQSEFEIVGNQS